MNRLKRRLWTAALIAIAPIVIAGRGTGQTERRPEEVAREFLTAYNAHDVARLMSLYADDVTVTTPDLTVVQGKADQERYFTAWFHSVPDVADRLISLSVEEDRFVLELQETGTYRKRLPSKGSPVARDQALSYPYVIVARVRDGRMTRVRIYENDLVLEKQLKMRP